MSRRIPLNPKVHDGHHLLRTRKEGALVIFFMPLGKGLYKASRGLDAVMDAMMREFHLLKKCCEGGGLT